MPIRYPAILAKKAFPEHFGTISAGEGQASGSRNGYRLPQDQRDLISFGARRVGAGGSSHGNRSSTLGVAIVSRRLRSARLSIGDEWSGGQRSFQTITRIS